MWSILLHVAQNWQRASGESTLNPLYVINKAMDLMVAVSVESDCKIIARVRGNTVENSYGVRAQNVESGDSRRG